MFALVQDMVSGYATIILTCIPSYCDDAVCKYTTFIHVMVEWFYHRDQACDLCLRGLILFTINKWRTKQLEKFGLFWKIFLYFLQKLEPYLVSCQMTSDIIKVTIFFQGTSMWEIHFPNPMWTQFYKNPTIRSYI